MQVYSFWEQTLEKWVEQGAPKELINPRFRRDYFQFFHMTRLESETEFGAIGEGHEVPPSKIDLGRGITVGARALSPIIPAYEPRFISEDEHNVILRNGGNRPYCRYSQRSDSN